MDYKTFVNWLQDRQNLTHQGSREWSAWAMDYWIKIPSNGLEVSTTCGLKLFHSPTQVTFPATWLIIAPECHSKY